MSSFFATMNFVRAVMVVCLLASGALGWLVKEERAAVADLRQVVAEQAPETVHRIQNMAVQIDDLAKQKEGTVYQSIENPMEYIRLTATKDRINLGAVDVTPPREKIVLTATVDRSWNIVPADRKRPYQRSEISNYFYTLEAQSPHVKVTNIEITPVDKFRPEEVGPDRWTFKATLTSRQSKE